MRRSRRNKIVTIFIPILLVFISLGYASLNTSLGINAMMVIKGNAFTVTFDGQGKTVPSSIKTVRYNQNYGTLPTPTMTDGNNFLGWYTSPTGGTKIDSTTNVSTRENHTLYARYSVMLKSTYKEDRSFFRSDTYRQNIDNIYFEDTINVPGNAVASWDIGVNQNGDVMAYVVPNVTFTDKYDLHIQSNDELYANQNMSFWFYDLKYLESFHGLNLLNTTKVTNMSSMFENAGSVNPFSFIHLNDNFDTSNVTDMSYMFKNTGGNSLIFDLFLGDKFDTSKVTNMAGMFDHTGVTSTDLTLDLGDKFDTSNVTNMNKMFQGAGIDSEDFTLNLGNKFNTSKVTDMAYMFDHTGNASTHVTIDLGDKFDTSNVTNMAYMFRSLGNLNPTFTLNLGNLFNTSKVTNMEAMFDHTGFSSSVYTLNLGSKFYTSNVTDMSYMFRAAGYSNPNFTLNLGSNFNTSNVTNMEFMFHDIGYVNNSFRLNCSSWNVNKVTKHTDFNLGATTKVIPPVWVS